MVFKDRDKREAVITCILLFTSLTLFSIATDSLNKPLDRRAKHKSCLHQLVKSSSTTSCQRVYLTYRIK